MIPIQEYLAWIFEEGNTEWSNCCLKFKIFLNCFRNWKYRRLPPRASIVLHEFRKASENFSETLLHLGVQEKERTPPNGIHAASGNQGKNLGQDDQVLGLLKFSKPFAQLLRVGIITFKAAGKLGYGASKSFISYEETQLY